jgi:endonuclease-8
MPEGDTIYRAARAMHRVLAGATVTDFETGYAHLARVNDDTPIAGRTIEKVEARGKWLMIHFSSASGDLILLTHMLMSGSWHLYKPGERWQLPRRAMRVLLSTKEWEAVGFNIPVAEFHTAGSLERKTGVPKLGPDILSGSFTLQQGSDALTVHKLANPDDEIGNALLNQRVIAGLGNVYKSEVCFAAGVHPFRTMQSITPAEIILLTEIAHRYMTQNVKDGSSGDIVTYTGMRRTTHATDHGARLWVYRRNGQECRRCGAIIRSHKQGLGARTAFWCPQCQPMKD